MQQADELEPLVTKPVTEEVAPGELRPSWPAPWISGEHLHALWRETVLSPDQDRKRAAADLYVNEYNFRWIRAADILVRAYAGDTARVRAGLKPLEDHEAVLLRRYREVFGAPSIFASDAGPSIGADHPSPAFMQTAHPLSPKRAPVPLPAAQMEIDLSLDENAPPPLVRSAQQSWRNRDGKDFKAV